MFPQFDQIRVVQREVETFLKSHSKEQVLTVLLEGEPEKVFPEVLCYEERKVESEDGTEQTVKVRIEPMAADIRGKDKSEIKKEDRAGKPQDSGKDAGVYL